MKLWIKTIICLMLVFIIALSPITSGFLQVRKAEASFVPFIVENAEWLLAILAGFGISFATQNDALAGVHDFAYNLDQSAYSELQNYIEGQKIKNATGLVIGDLLTGGLLTDIYDYVKNLPVNLAAAGGHLLIDYIISNSIENIEENDNYYVIPFINSLTVVIYTDNSLPSSVSIGWVDGGLMNLYNSSGEMSFRTKQKSYNFNYGYAELKFVNVSNGYAIYVNNHLLYNYTGRILNDVRLSKDIDIWVDYKESESISWNLENDIGISIDENIGALPLPAQGVSSPWDNTIVVPPSSVSEGVNLSPQDVLQQPAIDNFNNPVLDGVGNPVYEPVPQTWPNTQNPAYPPWPLTPDIEGVAEGTGVIGGILENIRDWVGDIGTFLTTDLPRILSTDIPLAIENIFNNPPPGDNENDVSDKMKDFKLPDLIFLFFGVILACIRLMIRFITFLTSLLLRPADSSIIPAGMKESLNFLKNWSIGLPVSFYTLFSSLMAFFFGLRMIKYIKIFVANVHGGITQSYDPREFNENEVYNEWSRSGYKTDYSDYRKVYDNWKDSNSNLPWKGYLKREARGRKW